MENKLRSPNFFILGAGRCGTTTLYHMLKQHKEIYMPKVKEPSFFCSHFQVIKNPITYFELFRCKNEPMIGEASHVYLSNRETPEILHSLFPNAKFVLILRNPTNRAYSLYNWARQRKIEPIGSFQKAIKEEKKRYNDPKFIKTCRHYFWNYMYVNSSYYDVQIKRYLKFFKRDRFCFINLFEFSQDPNYWIRYICDFLNISKSFNPIFKHHNKRKYPKMEPKIRKILNKKFEKTIIETEKIVGRKMYLNKL